MTITGRDEEFRAVVTILYQEELGRDPDPAGLVAWVEHARQGWTGDQLRAAIHASGEAAAYRARPQAPPPVAPLRIEGRDFLAQDGSRCVLTGCDAFTAFRTWLDGGDLIPLIAESRALGFTLWRVFFMGSRARNGMLELSPTEPDFYPAVRPFADALNAAGLVLLATIFVDAQDLMPSAPARLRHWQEMARLLRGSVTILSGGNEWSKNGFSPAELDDPQMIWSRGSDVGDAAPFQPYGAVAEFHPRRDLPASLLDTVASPVFIDRTLAAPLLIDEPPRMGLQGSGPEYADPHVCWQFARAYATFCGGAVFHSRAGQSGHLLDPVTKTCAEAWVRGMRL